MDCFPSMEQWNDCLSGKKSSIRLRMLWVDLRLGMEGGECHKYVTYSM